ncbi:MAG: hypothetical protein JXB17_11110 [Bacteroidales bacterium]|nr:hypothetical protein [Bacteroidales bacterium]
MKKINIKLLAIFLSSAIVMIGCNPLEKMKEASSGIKYTVNPRVLEMHGGAVEASITGDIPGKFFNKNAILTFTPVLKYEGGETELEPFVLQGEAVQANNKSIPYEAGGQLTHNVSFEYKDEMKVSELVLRIVAEVKGKNLPFPDAKIADGIIATPKLVKIDPKSILMSDNFKRIIPVTKEADIHYVINKADIRNSELKQEDIKLIEEFIKKVKDKERLEFTKAKISAYASPDGPYDFNENLSVNRQKSAKKFTDLELKGAKEIKAEGFFALESTAEDWDGFKTLMEKSDIKDKELILRVLSMYTDPVVREKEIKNISHAYLEIADKVLPKLRRSKIIIDANEVGYSDDELKDLATSNPDTLNVEELLYSATLVEDDKVRLEIYKATVEKFPECFRAQNNIGVVELDLDNMEGAKGAFEAANQLKESNAIITNNMGAVALLEGDLENAKEILSKATDAGDLVNYNLGIISIIEADYEAGLNYLAKSNSFNQALCMLLAGNKEAAMNKLDQVENPDADVYYLKAVIGARAQDQNTVMNNLRTAVGKDATLKEYAKTDIEFAAYFEDETFKTIVQ